MLALKQALSLVTLGKVGDTTPSYQNLYSLDFDGVDDYVDLGNSSDFSFGNGVDDTPFSFSIWYKSTNIDSTALISKSTTVSAEREWYLYFGGDGRLYLHLWDNVTGGYVYMNSNVALPEDGNWHNVTVTYDGVGGSTAYVGMKMYLDGSIRASSGGAGTIGSGSYVAMDNKTYPVWVAGFQTTSTYFEGNIDEISMWSKELSLSEVANIYNSGDPTNLASESGLIGYWRNGDTAGTSVYPTIEDYSANSNDGTMTNMASGDIVTVVP